MELGTNDEANLGILTIQTVKNFHLKTKMADGSHFEK